MATNRNIRLFMAKNLTPDSIIEIDSSKAHYLHNVMRCAVGSTIKCFNREDGEFLCEIKQLDKKTGALRVIKQIRDIEKESDIWLVFAPLKKDCTDFVVEKSVELGVSKIIPINTAYSISNQIKHDRFCLQAVEAAEQCERLSVPEVAPMQKLEDLLASWDKERVLYFLNERRDGQSTAEVFARQNSDKAAILVGPEGGFSDAEAKLLKEQSFVKNISLGPRILRAETAAVAALSVWQAIAGDWKNKKD